jgi:hypothetical protein
MAGTSRKRRLQRCKQPSTGGHCCHAAVCRQRSDCSWFRLIHSAVMYGGSDTTKAVKDKMSAVVKKAPQHLAPASRDRSLTFCTGTLGYFHPVYLMLPNCVGSTDARTWRLADGPVRRCDSHSRVAVVSAGLRWARTGAVMSNPLLSRSSTP